MPRVGIDFEGNTASFDNATKKVARDLSKFEAQAKSSGRAITAAFAGLGAGISLAGVTALIKKNIDFADNLRDLSKSTGLAVKDLAGLDLAAKQSGTSLEGIASAVNKLSVNIGKDGDKFRQLGITAKEPLEALAQLSDVFVGIEDPQKRAAVAAAALGKSWQETAPLLSEGGDAIRQMVKDGQRLTPVTEEMAAAADKFNDDMAAMGATLSSVGIKLTGPVLDGFNQLFEAIKNATKAGASFSSVMQGVVDFATGADTTELGKLNSQIDTLQSKISAMRNQGAIGGLIDDATGQDINLELNRLDALKKKRDELIEQQKKVAAATQAASKPKITDAQADAFIAGGEGQGKGSKDKGAVVFNNEQLAKSEAIIKRLVADLSLTREQASGVVGNLFQESNLNNKVTNSIGAFGLAQWLGDRKKELQNFARSRGTLATDFNTQIDFIVKEFQTSERKALDRLRNTSGLQDAALVVRKQFERPGEAEANDARRFSATKTAFLGGLTDSEQKKLLADQESGIRASQEAAERYKATLASLNVEIADSQLPELQRMMAQDLRQALEQAGLDTANLTEEQKKQVGEIQRLIEVKYFQAERERLLADQVDKTKEAFEKYGDVMQDVANISEGIVGSDELTRGLAKIQDALTAGVINQDAAKKLQDQLGTEFNRSAEIVQAGTDKMTEFSVQAARNMQSSFADFLFDPFKDGVSGMVDGFATALRRMAAEALAAEVFNYFGKKGGGNSQNGVGAGDVLKGIGNVIGSIFGNIKMFDTGTPYVPKTGLAIIHEGEKIIPAKHNRQGTDPWGGGGRDVVINQTLNVGQGADRDMVRKAAGQGAREALAVMGGANRYR